MTTNTWHHAAVTYSTSTGHYDFYLDGVHETVALSGSAPWPSPDVPTTQHAALGATLTDTGALASTPGIFQGVMDEARIWNVVRAPSEIASNKDLELTSGTGLIGRFGMNEGTGITVTNSIATRASGNDGG